MMNYFVKLLKIIILQESCPKNCVGKIVQQFTPIVSESYPTNSPWRIVQRIYIGGFPTIKTNIFVWKMIFIHSLGMCEGVGEDSRHGIGHVDIQVGSCICLNVFSCHYMCT